MPALGNTSSTAAPGNHTHTTSINKMTMVPSGTITLDYGDKYQLSAGGTLAYFIMPSLGTGSTDAAAGDHNHDTRYLQLSGGIMTGAINFQNGDFHIGLSD